MKNSLLLIFFCLLLALTGQTQTLKGQLDIQLNKNILQPGDSLFVTADYKDGDRQIFDPPIATLELIVENDQSQRTRLRWPVINGQASGALHLPDSLPPGRYSLFAGLQDRFFEVTGKIRNATNSSIQAMLLTKSGEWDEQDVPVAPDGTFAIRNWLFEDNALLAFAGTQNINEPLDISISTQLDSSKAPLAVAGIAFYIGNPSTAMKETLNHPVEIARSAFTDQAKLLPAVLVRTTVKTVAQQFNEEYVSGMFRSADERMISIMDDPRSPGQQNILSFLQGRVAGLQLTQVGFSGGQARWRGSPVTFFMDEIRVPAEQVANIPMSDIAIVKAFPSPFIGAPGGNAAIAVYTRRGNEGNYLPAHRQVFKVRGFTPGATDLNMNKMSL